MKTKYMTTILGFGNHVAIEIPSDQLKKIGGSKRAPLKITVNNYTYQSTATVKDGMCLVVFPMRDRLKAGVAFGDKAEVTLELDSGYRKVELPEELKQALIQTGLRKKFNDLVYSRRKEYARQVVDAKAITTKTRRIEKIIAELSSSK